MAETSDETHPTHLSPSELGTKEYWETFYSRTLTHISSKQPPTTPASADQVSNSERNSDEGRVEDDSNSDTDDDDNGDGDSDYNGDSDPGTSWFSEHNAPQKVLSFLTGEGFPLAPCHTLSSSSSTAGSGHRSRGSRRRRGLKLTEQERTSQPSILDLGTGNGSMLALLRKRGGYRGEMVGVDYSTKSVQLARELQDSKRHDAYLSGSDDDDSDFEYATPETDAEAQAETEEEEEEWHPIRFEEWDILGHTPGDNLPWFPYGQGGFDIVLDKGTFDAVSLMVEKSECERYPAIAGGLVRKGGFLIVTSCNWTEEELVRWFTSATPRVEGEARVSETKLAVWGRVQYPRFRFGGQEGQGVCTVCFQRV
ncbi:methyltransferase domain-containing protein [Aspergillus californicus]